MDASVLAQWPRLRERLAPVTLGEFPTPVERLPALERELGAGALFVKRDDLSSAIYGGNKVRTLEVLFALASAASARQVVAVGAYGSNHAVATALHAPRAGLLPAALLFPQPHSAAALENLRVTAARSAWLRTVPHWSCLPFGMWRALGPERFVMVPGGATPDGALGYVAAAFELGQQVERGELPAPARIVVGVGSTCTSAGLLLGLSLAARAGLFAGRAPRLRSVRVSPWPVTGRFRIVDLALRTARRLAELTGDSRLLIDRSTLSAGLEIDGSELGPGYGRVSRTGLLAQGLFRQKSGLLLDTTYSAKSAAGFLALARTAPDEPVLFWSTKSTSPLPLVTAAELMRAPRSVQRWIERAEARGAER